ncbi:MAG: hypothetical protein ACLQU1_25580 [Bryobacteraceae bacterium]
MIEPGLPGALSIDRLHHGPFGDSKRVARVCLLYALLAVALGLCWQATLVYSLYGGNWTGLFYQGYGPRLPNDPIFAHTYVFPDHQGYDGQYYRIVAHDLLLNRGWYRYLDYPSMRYHRILVPALAWLLAFGQQRYIDATFIAVILLFLFLGVYWLGRYAVLFGRHPAWGLAFLLAPATLSGLERATIDIALTAVTVGLAPYLCTPPRSRSLPFLLTLLLLAGLTRETGLVLVVACAAAALTRGDRRQLLVPCVAGLAALAWYAYVWLRVASRARPAIDYLPLGDVWENILLHHRAGYTGSGMVAIQLTYYLGVLGVLLAFFLVIRHCFAYAKSPGGLAMLGLTLLGVFVDPAGMWWHVYAFGRVLAPLLVLLGLEYFSAGDWRKALPLCMVSPGMLAVSAASASRVLQHLVHKS